MAFEHKVRTTYEHLAALGQEDLATILAPQPSGELGLITRGSLAQSRAAVPAVYATTSTAH